MLITNGVLGMQINKQLKVALIAVSCVVVALTLIVAIDKLDFVARWLSHLEAYKDNVERMIYACLFLLVLSSAIKKVGVGKFGKNVKGFKANAGIFGFEVEFNDDDERPSRNHCEDAGLQTSAMAEKQSRHNRTLSREYAMGRKIISILSVELQLTFATNTILSRGGCRYMPDGFAVRNGRAYIVEVKAIDRPDVIERAVAQLKTFANMMQDTKIAHVTVILCVVSNQPAEHFASRIRRIDLGTEIEFNLRVFSPSLFEEMM